MVAEACEIREELEKEGHGCSLINARFVQPLDPEMADIAGRHKIVVSMEENVRSGGFGERFLDMLEEAGYTENIKFIHVAIPDVYVEHGNVEILKKETGIDKESVLQRIREALS